MPAASTETKTAPPAPAAPGRALSTLNEDGTRRWLRPRPSRGKFWHARRVVAWALMLVFAVLPYITVGGHPAMLIDLTNRKFHFFGQTLLPTDTPIFALLIGSVFVGIFAVTALFGRIWCGWACPQTVYMEFLYRPIERFFDGEPGRKQRIHGAAGLRKTLKHITFFLVTLYIAHLALAYFVGVKTLATWVTQSPLERPGAFLIMAATLGLMTFDFGYFREQTCLIACPYGRLQAALLDRKSLIVSYDPERGEPRGAKKRECRPPSEAVVSLDILPEPERRGDCIDCRMCVTTCPTGIDIREGLQMECIGCAQCIDACNAVMDKIQRPRGLIRYSSQAAMAGERARVFRPRLVIYLVVWAGLFSLMSLLFVTRPSAETSLLPRIGSPFYEGAEGAVANAIRLRVVNRAEVPARFTFSSPTDGVMLTLEENPILLQPGESRTTPVTLLVARSSFDRRGGRDVELRVATDHGFEKTMTFHALGPVNRDAPIGATP